MEAGGKQRNSRRGRVEEGTLPGILKSEKDSQKSFKSLGFPGSSEVLTAQQLICDLKIQYRQFTLGNPLYRRSFQKSFTFHKNLLYKNIESRKRDLQA